MRAFLKANVAFLEAAGADAIVMGCNTSCATAARYGWPKTPVPILDLIDAVAEAVAQSGAPRVGILATNVTARSGAYGAAIRRRSPETEVQELGAPGLVPLVEAGALEGPRARAEVESACAGFVRPLDALVLACTHFPLLDDHFAALLGAGVQRIDPAVVQAERAVAFARARGARHEHGATRYVTTGDPVAFRVAVERLCGPLGPLDAVGSQQAEQMVEDVH